MTFEPHFNGPAYIPVRDHDRLSIQFKRIFDLMCDGKWRTFEQIRAVTDDPPPSISAQLRHMRKKRFGSHTVNRRYTGNGLYEYQLVVNANA